MSDYYSFDSISDRENMRSDDKEESGDEDDMKSSDSDACTCKGIGLR